MIAANLLSRHIERVVVELQALLRKACQRTDERPGDKIDELIDKRTQGECAISAIAAYDRGHVQNALSLTRSAPYKLVPTAPSLHLSQHLA